MAENRIYAYCRVSKNDGSMTIENQIHAIEQYAKEKGLQIATFYKDECKGDTPVEKRAQLPVMLDNLRSGDTVIVVEVFRLHRSQSGLAKLYREIIEDKKANFITLNDKESILNTSQHEELDMMQLGVKNIILAVLSLCSELEKRNISTRTKRALSERKARGHVLGRPAVVLPTNFAEIHAKALCGEITHTKAMELLDLKRTSYYKLAQEYKGADAIINGQPVEFKRHQNQNR